jgi:hypothetical protein
MATTRWTDLQNLIIVACHAVYTACDFAQPEADSSWCLQPFQKGEPPAYIEHIRAGVELAARDEQALLLFSGGQTRSEAGPRSEAQSYWLLAEHFNWWGSESVRERAGTEEFARDSFENLLFGICRFRECSANYPEGVAVVSWGFKQERFDLHRRAIRFPEERFRFFGPNNPAELAEAVEGERRNGIEPFLRDPYGVCELSAKKRTRNPFNRQDPYRISCPELAALLEYGGRVPYSGPLPWDGE